MKVIDLALIDVILWPVIVFIKQKIYTIFPLPY